MFTWTIFQTHLSDVGLTQNRETMALWTLITVGLFYLSCVGTRISRNSLKQHLVEGPITYDFTLHSRVRDHTTWFWRCVGTALEHFLLHSHNFMVTTLGSWWSGPEIVRAQKKVSRGRPKTPPNHGVWSQALKCSVKPYVTGPSTGCYFTEFLFVWVLTGDKIE